MNADNPKNIYRGNPQFQHTDPLKIGVLLVNLGTPDAPDAPALRRYLKEFLSDPRVIELPKFTWGLILRLFVLPFRPAKSAALYRKVWTPAGSPLLMITAEQTRLLRERLETRSPDIVVDFAMRYGNPSVESVLAKMRSQNVTRLLVIPLYPQYSSSTTGSTFDAVADALKTWRWVPEFRFVSDYPGESHYIAALAEKITATWKERRPEKLLFSFHGIPKRYFTGGDPYPCQCQKTARLVAEQLGISREQYLVSFQSLFGKEEWIKPYTDETLKSWADAGVKSVDVVCPGFVADCLETLEEIDQLNRELFVEHGGEQFRYIPAVNDSARFIDCLEQLVDQHAGGWFSK